MDARDAQHHRQMPPMPGVFPDYLAPIVRQAPTARELMLARWGMPGPPQFGGAPITNLRNTKARTGARGSNPKTGARCPSIPFANTPTPSRAAKTPTWFALNDDRPLAFFAGIWTSWHGKRGTKANPVEGEHQPFGF